MSYFKDLLKPYKWAAVDLLDALIHSKGVEEFQFWCKKYTLGAWFCGFLWCLVKLMIIYRIIHKIIWVAAFDTMSEVAGFCLKCKNYGTLKDGHYVKMDNGRTRMAGFCSVAWCGGKN